MLNMTDPGVQVFKRAIFEKEVEEAGKINFGSHRMNIGFAITRYYKNEDGSTTNDRYQPMPAEVLNYAGFGQSFGGRSEN